MERILYAQFLCWHKSFLDGREHNENIERVNTLVLSHRRLRASIEWIINFE